MSSDLDPRNEERAKADGQLQEHSVSDLISRLGDDMTVLFRQEVELAKVLFRDEMELAKGRFREEAELAKGRFREDMELAKTELKDEAIAAGKAGGMLGAGGVLGFVALLLIAFAASWGLAEVLPAGFAFLIVGLVFGAGAAALGAAGKKRLQAVDPVPHATIEKLQQDKDATIQNLQQNKDATIQNLQQDKDATIDSLQQDKDVVTDRSTR